MFQFPSPLSCLLLVSVSVVQFEFSYSAKTPSGLYHDDGQGHTILTTKFSKKDVREISYDILNIMGFNHRPHPHLVDTHSPASQFLLEVYNSISAGETESVDLSNMGRWGEGSSRVKVKAQNLTYSQFNVDSVEVEAISKADAIISFTNRGMYMYVLHIFRSQVLNCNPGSCFCPILGSRLSKLEFGRQINGIFKKNLVFS
jgi:hypothetical protein